MKTEQTNVSDEKIQVQIEKENIMPEESLNIEKLHKLSKPTSSSGGGWGPSYGGRKPQGIGWR